MRLINRKLLEKFKRKHRGNRQLISEVDKLISDIESFNWRTPLELKTIRPDADKVHSDGFYIFNTAVSRTMVLIEFSDFEATIVWVGNHQLYESLFRNNKSTIKKWLLSKGWIEK